MTAADDLTQRLQAMNVLAWRGVPINHMRPHTENKMHETRQAADRLMLAIQALRETVTDSIPHSRLAVGSMAEIDRLSTEMASLISDILSVVRRDTGGSY